MALQVRGAVKRYADITAVAGVDLDIPYGTCLGLLGPNGAGKSTTMRLLTGQSRADEGTIEVLGYRIPEQSKQARALMGVVPQQDNLDIELTARQNLEVFAHLYRVPVTRPERRRRLGAGDSPSLSTALTPRPRSSPVACAGGC